MYNVQPLPSNGGTQDTLLVHHKGVIEWSVKSRLPKAKYLSKLVWEIIGDVADGKVINQVVDNIQLTPKEQAIKEWSNICEMTLPMMRDLLGYSQGALRRTAIELGIDIETKTLEKVLPNEIKYDPEAGTPVAMDNTKGTHAALKKLGTEGWNTTAIAESFGNKITASDVNKALIQLGLQVPMNASALRFGYVPTPKAEDVCNSEIRSSGQYKGFKAVKSWMYLEIQDRLDPLLFAIAKGKK